MKIDLSKFHVGDYRGGSAFKTTIWYLINYYIFDTAFPWPYGVKSWLLKLFGARIGSGLVIKTNVRIKYPWRLTIGDHCWIGESVWIDNLAAVNIGNSVALSQGAMLLTGNHDYSASDFRYRLGEITLHDGVWIGAKAIVCPGVTCHSHAILTVNSVANRNLEPFGIYAGNPAVRVRTRTINK